MNYHFDEQMTCPYNKAHVFLRGRAQTHLAKCRTQYEIINAGNLQYSVCTFNTIHVIPTPELEIHEDVCPDRRAAEELMIDEEQTIEAAPIHSQVLHHIAAGGDDWDNEVTEQPVLQMIQERAKTKPVLLSVHGKSQSVRKDHRIQEKIRHRELNEKK